MPESVEFFLEDNAEAWQQSVGVAFIAREQGAPHGARLSEDRKEDFFCPVALSTDRLHIDHLLAREVLQHVGRMMTLNGDVPAFGLSKVQLRKKFPASVLAAQKTLEALFHKDPNDWTKKAEVAWRNAEKNGPKTLFEEAVDRWFKKDGGVSGAEDEREKRGDLTALSWWIALNGGDEKSFEDTARYAVRVVPLFYQKEDKSFKGFYRFYWREAVTHFLLHFYQPLSLALFHDCNSSKTAGGSPADELFCKRLQKEFRQRKVVSIYDLRALVDDAYTKYYKRELPLSVKEDIPSGAPSWLTIRVSASLVVYPSFIPVMDSPMPATLAWFTKELPSTINPVVLQALVLRGFERPRVCPASRIAVYQSHFVRTFLKHAGQYLHDPSIFAERGTKELDGAIAAEVQKKRDELVAIFTKDPRKWSRRVREAWEKRAMYSAVPSATFFDEAVRVWYRAVGGPPRGGFFGKRFGKLKDFTQPIALFIALNGGKPSDFYKTSGYTHPTEGNILKKPYDNMRKAYFYLINHFLRYYFGGLEDALHDDLQRPWGDKARDFAKRIKDALHRRAMSDKPVSLADARDIFLTTGTACYPKEKAFFDGLRTGEVNKIWVAKV